MGLAPAISRSQGKRPDHKATLPNQGRHMAYMLRQVNEEFLFVISFGESVPSRDFAGCDETKNACERNETLGTKLNLKLTSAILEFLGCESDGKFPMLFDNEELIKKKKKATSMRVICSPAHVYPMTVQWLCFLCLYLEY